MTTIIFILLPIMVHGIRDNNDLLVDVHEHGVVVDTNAQQTAEVVGLCFCAEGGSGPFQNGCNYWVWMGLPTGKYDALLSKLQEIKRTLNAMEVHSHQCCHSTEGVQTNERKANGRCE